MVHVVSNTLKEQCKERILNENSNCGLEITLPKNEGMHVEELFKNDIISENDIAHFGVVVVKNFINSKEFFPVGCNEPLSDFDDDQVFHQDFSIWRGRGNFDHLMIIKFENYSKNLYLIIIEC